MEKDELCYWWGVAFETVRNEQELEFLFDKEGRRLLTKITTRFADALGVATNIILATEQIRILSTQDRPPFEFLDENQFHSARDECSSELRRWKKSLENRSKDNRNLIQYLSSIDKESKNAKAGAILRCCATSRLIRAEATCLTMVDYSFLKSTDYREILMALDRASKLPVTNPTDRSAAENLLVRKSKLAELAPPRGNREKLITKLKELKSISGAVGAQTEKTVLNLEQLSTDIHAALNRIETKRTQRTEYAPHAPRHRSTSPGTD